MQARKFPLAEPDELDALGALEADELVELAPEELLPQAASNRAAAEAATAVISEVCLTVISSEDHVACTELAQASLVSPIGPGCPNRKTSSCLKERGIGALRPPRCTIATVALPIGNLNVN